MTAEELIAKAETELKSVAGSRYNPQVLKEIIERRAMDDGTVFATTGNNGAHLVYFSDRVVKIDGGQEVQTMPMDEKTFEAALVMFAKREAKRQVAH